MAETLFDRFSPGNLPSLTQQQRTAFAALQAYLPLLEQHIYEQARSRFQVFADLTERDAFFGTPETGDACIVDNGEGGRASTLWVYHRHTKDNGNWTSLWLPFDLGWNTFTPTLNNITLGSGTAEGRYKREFTDCKVEFNFTMGAGSAVAGNPGFVAPFPGIDELGTVGTALSYGQALLLDTAAADVMALVFFLAGATTFVFQYLNAAGTGLTNASVNATTPFTFDATDQILCKLVYEMDVENIVFTS
jgi:hypothetical protein